ncbi:MAG: AAA family ATPase, partial [SAR324 cluster bacterium]|nr:AAA family ATPase [SAR324 cluster bacterium]
EQRRDTAEKFTLESLTDEVEPGPLQYIWDPLLPAGFPSNIYGDGGASKSTTMMGLSVAITLGARFLGLPTVAGPVFYLDWELDKPTFLRRLYAICRGMGLPYPPKDLHYARLTEPLAAMAGRTCFAPAWLAPSGEGPPAVTPLKERGEGGLPSSLLANALIQVPEGKEELAAETLVAAAWLGG